MDVLTMGFFLDLVDEAEEPELFSSDARMATLLTILADL
jgi:hypothetical protein